MNITILKTIEIKGVPSGSGLVKLGDVYYVIGDDAPFLFCLNNDFKIISKTPLIDNYTLSDGGIEKSKKPDFESLEMINKNELITFGSGSKSPERDLFIRILLKDALLVEQYNISNFYNKLRELPIFEDSELNIEAAAYYNKYLFLFNRKKNLIIKLKYLSFLNYLKGDSNFPVLDIKEYSLPNINGIEAGFSGATILKNSSKIIFTASVEDTDNAYDDGEILGSFVGLIKLKDMELSSKINSCLIPSEGEKLKVESVSIVEELSKESAKLVFVTDDDKGNSLMLEAVLDW